MKKFTRREKNILKMMLLMALVGAMVEGYDRYNGAKEKLSEQILAHSNEMSTFMEKMGLESTLSYQEKTKAVDAELAQLGKRVLRLPTEADASLLIRQTITELGDKAGVKINSLSERSSRVAGMPENSSDKPGDELKVRELRTYFAFEAELAPLVKLIDALAQREYYLSVDSFSISSRQQIRRIGSKQTYKRVSLSGSAVLITLFQQDPAGKSDALEASVKNVVLANLVVKEIPEEKPEVKPAVKPAQARPVTNPPTTFGGSYKPQPTNRQPTAPTVNRLPPVLVKPPAAAVSTPMAPQHEPEEDEEEEGDDEEELEGESDEEELPTIIAKPPPNPIPSVNPPAGGVKGLSPNVPPIKPPAWQPTPKPQSGSGRPLTQKDGNR